MAEEKPKVPRKRARKAPAKKAVAKKRAPAKKKVATPKTTTPKRVPRKTVAARKAPTPIASTNESVAERSRRQKKRLAIFVSIIVIGVGSSVAIGYSDPGAIDVSSTLAKKAEERKARAEQSGEVTEVTPPKDIRAKVANGGLVSAGTPQAVAPKKDRTHVPKPNNATSSATSTTATASSTDGVADGVSDDVIDSNTSTDTEAVGQTDSVEDSAATASTSESGV